MTEAALRVHLLGLLAARPGGDAAHDLAHVRRVLAMAHRIAVAEGPYDAAVLTAAACLHDWVALPKDDPRRAWASRDSAAAALPILAAAGCAPAIGAAAAHAIEAHSFSAGIAPRTPEARALQDADRLDALGAIGIARVFAVSGSLGRALFHPEDPFARHRAPEEQRYALDHVLVKLLRLPDTLQTATARMLAARRAVVLQDYLRALAAELGAVPLDGA